MPRRMGTAKTMSDERLDKDVPYHGGDATERAPAATGTSGGSGEHPDPNTPPTGAAPGTSPEGEEIEARREAQSDDQPARFKDVLDAVDPVTAGVGSTPEDHEGEADE